MTRQRRRLGFFGLLFTLGLAAFAARSSGAFASAGFGGHCPNGDPDPAEAREHAGYAADWVLSSVDASDAQRAEIDALLDEAVPAMGELHDEGRALKRELREALTAEVIDEGAIEELRLDGLDLADRASAEGLRWVVAAAKVLDAEQRAELGELEHPRRHRGR